MELIITIIAIVILSVSVLHTRTIADASNPTFTPTPEATEESTASPISNPTETPKPTITIHLSTPTPAPTAQSPVTSNINDWQYPGSTVVNSSTNGLSLTSEADPKQITQWYKDRIKSQNFNVNSFVTTTANDKTLNKLVGSNGQKTISVEISQDSNSTPVRITIGTS